MNSSARQHLARRAGLIGDASWWLFVVASLITGGVDWWNQDRVRGASFSSEIYLYCSGGGDGQRSTCVTGTSGSATEDWFTDTSFYSLAAFIIVVTAALVQAVAVGRLLPGIANVAIPFVGFTLFLAATFGAFFGNWMRPIAALALVFAAVVIRETWAQWFRRTFAATPLLD